MTVAARNPPSTLSASLSLPQTQNTAPVYQHRCLYTHDLRRKQKRWQDGFLTYHTFNKRVMVTDVPRNHIGDMYTSGEVQDGDEVTLERGAVLVQVGERLGMEERDCSVVLAKRNDGAAAHENGNRPDTGGTSNSLRPRSSNLPPRTPSRFIGWSARAMMPQKSPFELKQIAQEQSTNDSPRPAKRQRREEDEHVPLWEILKTSRPSKARAAEPTHPVPHAPLRLPVKTAARQKTKNSLKNVQPPSQGTLCVKELIDLSSSVDEPAVRRQNQGVQGTCQRGDTTRNERLDRQRTEQDGDREVSIEGTRKPQPNRIARHRHPATEVETTIAVSPRPNPQNNSKASSRQEPTTNTLDRPSSPPVSTSNHLPPTEPQDVAPIIDLDSTNTNQSRTPPPEKRPLKPLRIATRAPRKRLLCADNDYDDAQQTLSNEVAATTTEEDFAPIEVAGSIGYSPGERDAGHERPISLAPDPANHENNASKSTEPHPQQPRAQELRSGDDAGNVPDARAENQCRTTHPRPTTRADPIPLRRQTTDPSASISNPRTASSHFKQPLRRVETHPQTSTATTAAAVPNKSLTGAPAARDRESNQRPSIVRENSTGDEQKESGPWTREAWDLFGWCPEAKRGIVDWCYG